MILRSHKRLSPHEIPVSVDLEDSIIGHRQSRNRSTNKSNNKFRSETKSINPRRNLSEHCLGSQNPNPSALKRSKSEQRKLTSDLCYFSHASFNQTATCCHKMLKVQQRTWQQKFGRHAHQQAASTTTENQSWNGLLNSAHLNSLWLPF